MQAAFPSRALITSLSVMMRFSSRRVDPETGCSFSPVLESKKLAECYRVECALLKEEDCDVASYEGVIAFTLTNEALGKIANGIFDTDYTRRFGTALLLGKRIFIAEEEVELYRYKDAFLQP